MKMHSFTKIKSVGAMLFLVAAVFVSCAKPVSSGMENTADQFMDQYYVAIDLKKAHALSSGLAASKIDESVRLIGQVTENSSGNAHPSAQKSEVSFKKGKVVEGKEEGDVYYDLTIKPKGGDAIHKKTHLKLRLLAPDADSEDRNWRVTQFVDILDESSSPTPVTPDN